MKPTGVVSLFLIISSGLYGTYGRIHTLPVKDDERSVIVMTSFGYLKGGSLEVKITALKISGQKATKHAKIGFSLDKSSSSGTSSYVEREESTRGCVLDEETDKDLFDVPRAIMKIVQGDDGNYYIEIHERALYGLKFYESYEAYKVASKPKTAATTPKTTTTTPKPVGKAGAEKVESEKSERSPNAAQGAKPASADKQTRRKRAVVPRKEAEIPKPAEDDKEYHKLEQPLQVSGNLQDGMNISFYVRVEDDDQIGLYELYFHNCENILTKLVKTGFKAHIVEKNGASYLSAGDMALPLMYGVISGMFFLAGIVWLHVICGTKERVFKIHYLMAVIIIVKGLSVMFHSLDYYFIAKDGRSEAWAVIYYIVHLLKGILLIICLLLIGTGWAFIKYILSDRDKKLFMIVIPMQVMVNVAYIIMEETEEGNKSYYTWKDIMILVDVLCCGAILIPVVWSIRHLQEASQTDGKAAMNLAKLQLFRHFYIMVVCYLYFTRIIVYLLEITLPFHYVWIHDLFSELGAFIFFSVTGYKFRPGCDNPYLKLEQCDEDDPEEALTQSGAMETLSRVNQREKDLHDTDEFDVLLPKQRTSKV